MNATELNNLLTLLCLVFLSLFPLIGIPFRFYQTITGALKKRMEISSGVRQLIGAFGILLVWVNAAVWVYTIIVLYLAFADTRSGEGVTGIGILMLWGACAACYAIMELFLLPVTFFMRPAK